MQLRIICTHTLTGTVCMLSFIVCQTTTKLLTLRWTIFDSIWSQISGKSKLKWFNMAPCDHGLWMDEHTCLELLVSTTSRPMTTWMSLCRFCVAWRHLETFSLSKTTTSTSKTHWSQHVRWSCFVELNLALLLVCCHCRCSFDLLSAVTTVRIFCFIGTEISVPFHSNKVFQLHCTHVYWKNLHSLSW